MGNENKRNCLRLGDEFFKSILITPEMIDGFAKYSGDHNPVHLDEEFASTTIFKKRIAHGFLVGSFISAVLGNELPGNGTIYLSQTMTFYAPVYISDRITVRVEITEFTSSKRVKLKTVCLNQDNVVVLDGEALIIPPPQVVLM